MTLVGRHLGKRAYSIRRASTRTVLVWMVAALACADSPPSMYLSPIDLAKLPGQNRLLVACATAPQMLVVDVPDAKVETFVKLPAMPSGIAVSDDAQRVYVTAGCADGVVLELDATTFEITRSLPVGHSPTAPRLSSDQKSLYVCNRFQHEVAVVDLASQRVTDRIRVTREPVAAALTPNGRLLFVANHLPAGRADADYIACTVSVIDTSTNTVVKTIRLVNGAEGARDIRVSPDGKYVYATHLVARYHVPTSQVTRGWINTNALSTIGVERQELLYTVLLDDVDRGFANPWGIDVSPDGKRIAVCGAGTHEISLIDLEALNGKIEDRARTAQDAGEARLDAHNDLAFLHGIRQRLPLRGLGPRSACFVGDDLYVAEYFSDSLGRVPNAAKLSKRLTSRHIESHRLAPEVTMSLERRGEYFFNDASLCLQGWQSCASCHPDARTDALNWDLMNDGIGNPKNVKSMLLAHATPPAMALGVRADAETAVRAGIQHIQFAVRPEEDAVAIDAYLKSLQPVPSPYLVDGDLSESALRGALLFQNLGCAQCHPSPLFTDQKQHGSSIAKGADQDKSFDTPTLIELWRTAPYLHDGRAFTLEEALQWHPVPGAANPLAELSDQQRRDLIVYLLSL